MVGVLFVESAVTECSSGWKGMAGKTSFVIFHIHVVIFTATKSMIYLKPSNGL